MLQGGDPTNTGKGGQSIWGSSFDDKFYALHKHDRQVVVSFANNGPGTNNSQFFITYILYLDRYVIIFEKKYKPIFDWEL